MHAALKAHYARPGDELEVPLEGFVVDIRRPNLLIEIQTSSFRSMGRKLDALLAAYRMLLVYPVAVETYLERPATKPRKSPKRGSVYSLFDELVSIPTLLDHPNLMLEVVLVSVAQVQVPSARARRGRGGYRTVERRLRKIMGAHRFRGTRDLVALLPSDLPPEFTTADIAAGAKISRDCAQRMAFCLRALEVLTEQRRSKAGIHYARSV